MGANTGNIKTKPKPYLNIGPGDFMKEELEIRKWTNEDLAQVLGLNPKTISELINNKQRITIDTAKLLNKAFGQSPQYWLNLDNNYRLRFKENNEESDVEIKSKIYERMPVNNMIKKGWIKKFRNTNELKNIFMQFWKLNGPDFNHLDNLVRPHCRRSDAYDNLNKYFILTWTQMAKLTSEEFDAADLNKKALRALAKEITNYSVLKTGVSKFLLDLYNTGVKFFSLSHLPRTYLDGASFLHDNNPVIVYTKRYDRLDNFWFTIAHEIGHILLHIKNENDIYIDDFKSKSEFGYEDEANDFAEKVLRVNEILDYFSEYKHYTSAYRVEEAAEELNINPAIIVGILKHYGILAYNRLNHFTEPVSNKIPKKYFVGS